jgi:CRISPR/Cas system-associated endoribonuclease Cas2
MTVGHGHHTLLGAHRRWAQRRLHYRRSATHVQRELFEHSIAGVEPREIALLKEQIARFLHKHKDDNRDCK